jgi:hypothetical protein
VQLIYTKIRHENVILTYIRLTVLPIDKYERALMQKAHIFKMKSTISHKNVMAPKSLVFSN